MKIIDWKIIVAGMFFITIAECVALLFGVNGAIYSLYLFIMGTLLGVTIPNPLTKSL